MERIDGFTPPLADGKKAGLINLNSHIKGSCFFRQLPNLDNVYWDRIKRSKPVQLNQGLYCQNLMERIVGLAPTLSNGEKEGL